MDRKILIKNAKAIVSCDSGDQVYWDSDILIEGPKITEIGKDIEAEGAEIIRGDGKFVYPGLINLTSIDYPNLMVMDWIDKIYRIFQIIDSDVIYYSSLTALGDLIKHGCTCAFDH